MQGGLHEIKNKCVGIRKHLLSVCVLTCLVVVSNILSGCSSTAEQTDGTSVPLSDSASTHQEPESLDPGGHSHLQKVDCWFADTHGSARATCYQMHVPQVYGTTDSRVISFPVVRLSKTTNDSKKAPILHLGGGGPGSPLGLDNGTVENWIWSWYQQMSLQQNRDLYLLDPRGVGLADPVLICREYIPAFLSSLSRNLTVQQEVTWNRKVHQQCIDRLVADGIEISAYNSLAVARDMEMLRRKLGIPKWDLYGVSYASRYALTIAREFPQTVEAMILDAAVFPNVRYMDNYAVNLQQAFDRLLSHCIASDSCSSVIADPQWRFWQLVRNLDRQPINTMVKHPHRDQQINLVLNGRRFLDVMYNALYDADKLDSFDQIIIDLEAGKLGTFEAYVNEWLAFQTDKNYGDASAAAHYCFEESPFIDYHQAIASAGELRFELRESAVALLEYNREQCQRWPIPPAPAVEGEPVTTDIPTLVLHGALDPVLPVENLDAQLGYFTNADYEIFDNTAHSIVGVDPCGEQLASAFYEYKLAFREHTDCLTRH